MMHDINAVLDRLSPHELAAIALRAAEVRRLQRRYFKERTQAALIDSKQAERELDGLLAPVAKVTE